MPCTETVSSAMVTDPLRMAISMRSSRPSRKSDASGPNPGRFGRQRLRVACGAPTPLNPAPLPGGSALSALIVTSSPASSRSPAKVKWKHTWSTVTNRRLPKSTDARTGLPTEAVVPERDAFAENSAAAETPGNASAAAAAARTASWRTILLISVVFAAGDYVPARRPAQGNRRRLRGRCERELDGEDGSAFGRGRGTHTAAVRVRHGRDDRQAETCSAGRARPALVRAIEALED